MYSTVEKVSFLTLILFLLVMLSPQASQQRGQKRLFFSNKNKYRMPLAKIKKKLITKYLKKSFCYIDFQ
jgi:hypothetical protein